MIFSLTIVIWRLSMSKAAELAKMGEVLTNGQIGGRRNIIINGSMQIFQRGEILSQSAGATTYSHSADRFNTCKTLNSMGRLQCLQSTAHLLLNGFGIV